MWNHPHVTLSFVMMYVRSLRIAHFITVKFQGDQEVVCHEKHSQRGSLLMHGDWNVFFMKMKCYNNWRCEITSRKKTKCYNILFS